MEHHEKLLATNASRHPDFDRDDFLPPIRDMAGYPGKLLGIPYRVTASILNNQKQLLEVTPHNLPAEPDACRTVSGAL